jgi:hypothetical protein
MNFNDDADRPDTVGVGDGELPVFELHDLDSRALRVLRTLQAALLKHPVASQAAFNALLAEGRRFAATPEGGALKAKLERSELVHRARLVLDFATLSLLEQDPPDVLPSAYLDVLFMLASSQRSDEILDAVFSERPANEPASR